MTTKLESFLWHIAEHGTKEEKEKLQKILIK